MIVQNAEIKVVYNNKCSCGHYTRKISNDDITVVHNTIVVPLSRVLTFGGVQCGDCGCELPTTGYCSVGGVIDPAIF